MAFRLRNFEKILYVKEILVVGQFEIKSIKKKELVPDVIELSVYAGDRKRCISSSGYFYKDTST